jgi:hypothetical protein
MGAARTVAARTDAAWLMLDGANAVRGLTPELSATARQLYPNGHMFERMADSIVEAATSAAGGRNVGRSIGESLEGAKILLQRESATAAQLERALQPMPITPQFVRP